MSPPTPKELDSDDESLASTLEGEPSEDAVYEVEEILAEKWDEWDHEPGQPVFRGVKYLTKWEGYPLEECTWEPKSAFSVPDADGNDLPGTPPLLRTWYDLKKSMSEAQFRDHCRENINQFNNATENAKKAKAIRKAERAKMRQKLALRKKRTRPVLWDSDDEDEPATPDQLHSRKGPQQAVPHETTAVTRNTCSGKQSRVVRKPPLEQSDVSASEGELSDLPAAESRKAPTKTNDSSIRIKTPVSGSQSRRNSAQLPCNPLQHAVATMSANPAAKPSQTKTAPSKGPQIPSQSLKGTTPQNVKLAIRASRAGGNRNIEKSTLPPLVTSNWKASTSTGVTKASPSGTSPAFAGRSANSASRASVKKANRNVGIRVVNQPKVQQRSEWTHGNRPFSTLHFRGLAQKRSRAEGTPDLAALEIVNDVSGNVKPKSQTTHDNPYGRREAGKSRREKSPESDRASRGPISGSLMDDNAPLAPWEVDKVPQVCASWRLSNNCQKTAQTCQFMHRNKDPNGRDYPIGDAQGRIPPKYRKPPLTCLHWLYKKHGCYKSDEQCPYAHELTGWIQSEKYSTDAIRIDPSIQPQHDKAAGPSPQGPGDAGNQKRLGPRDLTCWYWANGACRKSDEDCPYQHYDTGVVARPPPRRENDTLAEKAPRHDSITKLEALKESPLPVPDDAIVPQTTKIVEHVPKPTAAPPPPLPADLPVPKATCEDVRKQISSVCELDFEELFASNDDKSVTGLMDRRAFLVYHSEHHAAELELITRWLLLHHVQVFGVHYAGAWAEFQEQIKRGGSGVIIFHPDFEYFTRLPGLGEILCYPIRVWSVGVQEGIEYDPALTEDPPVYRYDAIEIFPVGGFIYITDEVFETEPQLALKIVELFFDKIAKLKQRTGPPCPGRQVEDASLLWRLCVRPELMEYLMEYCEQHEKELEAGDADVQSRARLYALLAETNYIEQDDATEPLSPVFDKHPILSERRVMAECEPMTYFATRARSHEAANANMVRYYAGLQVALRRDYRHLFVVHTQPRAACVQQWRAETQTIAEVLTPAQCVEELGRESEGSLFDFCERYMPVRDMQERDLIS